MGTRGLTGFIANEEWYVTYNHEDSDPRFLGCKVLKFCNSVSNWEALKAKVENLALVSLDESDSPTRDVIEKYRELGYGDTSIYTQKLDNWHNLLRGLQGDGILYEIEKGNLIHMIDSHAFLADSCHCEWAYIIDLDEMELRVYKGWVTEPFTTELKKNYLPSDIPIICDDDFYPVKLIKTYPLNKLPTRKPFLQEKGLLV